jgi:hypothetical protein
MGRCITLLPATSSCGMLQHPQRIITMAEDWMVVHCMAI